MGSCCGCCSSSSIAPFGGAIIPHGLSKAEQLGAKLRARIQARLLPAETLLYFCNTLRAGGDDSLYSIVMTDRRLLLFENGRVVLSVLRGLVLRAFCTLAASSKIGRAHV